MARHFLTGAELTAEEQLALLDRAVELKADPLSSRALEGKSVALLFEKPSMRTRVSFDVGVTELGGHAVSLLHGEVGMGQRESPRDIGLVLSRMVHAIGVRTGPDELLEELAEHASVPVINMLSRDHHPCQALADLLTVQERLGSLTGRTIVYLGDGNNVAHSLLLAGALAGMTVRCATPPGFEPIPQVVHRAEEIAARTGGAVEILHDPVEAATDADVLYTDVWASMGQEDEADERALVFPAYQLSQKLVDVAAPGVVVLHCLPAHRGQEITDEVIDGPHSAVWDQAENRTHTQRALLLRLLGLA
jgi:ornithine carbamoyltransferase